jgi:acyl carrier protein
MKESLMKLTQDKLEKYIITTCNIGSVRITLDTSLFESGLLDSIQLLGLVEFIEVETDNKIANSDITLENMDSIKKILKFTSRN